MLIFAYSVVFIITAVVFIVVKSVKVNEYTIENDMIQRLTNISTYFKGIPAALAALFVFVMRPDNSLFYIILVGAFLFCLAGDIGMEKGITTGLPLFLIAQILFSAAFIGQALRIDSPNLDILILTSLVALGTAAYVILFIRYLESSDVGLLEFKIPVLVYCVFLSAMFISTVLLWITSEEATFIIVVIGALLFLISDSTIGVREFHHKITKGVLKTMSTYYSAIFLLSSTVLIL